MPSKIPKEGGWGVRDDLGMAKNINPNISVIPRKRGQISKSVSYCSHFPPLALGKKEKIES